MEQQGKNTHPRGASLSNAFASSGTRGVGIKMTMGQTTNVESKETIGLTATRPSGIGLSSSHKKITIQQSTHDQNQISENIKFIETTEILISKDLSKEEQAQLVSAKA